MARDDNMIAALLRERAGYQARGLSDRVEQVNAQLEHHGYSPERDQDDGPQGRTGTDPAQQTADASGTGAKPPAAPAAKKATAKKATAAPPAPKE